MGPSHHIPIVIYSSALLTCNRFWRKLDLHERGAKKKEKGTANPSIGSFWFPIYFKMMCTFDLCGKLIRFIDCSRYSSGNSVCHDPQKKKKNPETSLCSKHTAALLGVANYFHCVRGVHFCPVVKQWKGIIIGKPNEMRLADTKNLAYIVKS